MRYAIIGTGALGGYYGARLQRSGADVHFLLNSDFDRVKTHGLVVESIYGDFTLPTMSAYRDASEMPPCDAVVICLKTTQNHLLPQLLPPLAADAAILTLQNGLNEEPAIATLLAERLGKPVGNAVRVAGGTAHICSNKIGPGHIRHSDYGRINLAAHVPEGAAREIPDWLRAIASDFEAAGIETSLSENLLDVRWHKLVWNIPFNGLSVIIDAKTDAMMGNEHTRSLLEQLMQEVVAGAAAYDVEIARDFVQLMLDSTAVMTPYLTSMKLDFDNRRPLEVESIYGNPIRAAQARGVAMPKTEALYQQLCFLNERNLIEG
ncbi:MAG: putative 2-dehydropantoate 2-reductase [Cyanobacteria bacterium P01_G01_bin.4]